MNLRLLCPAAAILVTATSVHAADISGSIPSASFEGLYVGGFGGYGAAKIEGIQDSREIVDCDGWAPLRVRKKLRYLMETGGDRPYSAATWGITSNTPVLSWALKVISVSVNLATELRIMVPMTMPHRMLSGWDRSEGVWEC